MGVGVRLSPNNMLIKAPCNPFEVSMVASIADPESLGKGSGILPRGMRENVPGRKEKGSKKKNMKCLLFVVLVAVCLLFQTGCSGGSSPSAAESTAGSTTTVSTTVSTTVPPTLWQRTPGSSGMIASLAIDPANTQTVYAGSASRYTPGGIIKTTNGAASWTEIANGITCKGVNALAIDPHNSQTLYAGGSTVSTPPRGDVIFKTINGGASWTAISTDLPYGIIGSLAVDPANSQVVYAGITTAAGCGGGPCPGDIGSLFKSINGGASWATVKIGSAVTSFAIDPRMSEIAYAGTDAGGVFKTTDGGVSWTAINDGLTTGSRVTSLAIDLSNSQVIYAASYVGVFKTLDGGTSWTAIPDFPTGKSVNYITIDPSSTQIVYAGTNDGVFKTLDGGLSWTAISAGLTNHYVHSLAIDPLNTKVVYAGTNDGVFKLLE